MLNTQLLTRFHDQVILIIGDVMLDHFVAERPLGLHNLHVPLPIRRRHRYCIRLLLRKMEYSKDGSQKVDHNTPLLSSRGREGLS